MGSCNGCSDLKAPTSRMRHRVKFQHLVLVQDGIGGHTSTYETYFETWAAIDPAKSGEKWQADQLSLRVSHKITTRYFDGLESDDRILFGTRSFEVQEVKNLEERNIVFELMANEGDAS